MSLYPHNPDDSDTFDLDPAGNKPAAGRIAANTVLAGRFRVVRLIAAGGMGEVYEAHDNELGEPVAIKVLRADIAGDSHAMARFRREVQLARQVAHRSVCRCHDIFHHEPKGSGQPLSFLSMELLGGVTLSAHLNDIGRLTEAESLPIIKQICGALAAAHARGIVHRDLKPSNVILVQEEQSLRAVVTDFGLARMTEASPDGSRITAEGAVVGTPAYMAPEQLTDGVITPATDVYALGVLLYEMVTGHLPFTEGRGEIMDTASTTEESSPADIVCWRGSRIATTSPRPAATPMSRLGPGCPGPAATPMSPRSGLSGAAAGHDIGNHSYSHPYELARFLCA